MNRPLRSTRGAPWSLILALGCASHEHSTTSSPDGGTPPGAGACALTKRVEVALDLLGELSDPPALVPFGERFAMIDGESIISDKIANAALVSWQGVDSQTEFELTELCPDGICRNIHGSALLATAAADPEFLLAEQGSAVSMPAYPLRALAWDGGGSPAHVTPLFETRVTAITTRAALESSRDAGRALFVLGNIDMPTLEAVEITAGATLVAPPAALTLPGPPWDCVAVVPTDAAGAISAVTKLDSGTDAVWTLRELDAQANVRFETNAPVPIGDALGFTDCPTVVESATGFHAQWVGTDGASVIATIARDAEAGAAPALLALDASAGALEGVLHDDFVFLAPLDGGQQGFIRLDRDGNPGGPGITLPALPPATLQQRRATPKALELQGSAVAISYELESTRVFEEWSCP